MNILMVNLPFSGHTNPTLPLTRELIRRGHDVTYINAPEFADRIGQTGARFVPYTDYPSEPSEQEKKTLCFAAAFETAAAMKGAFDVLIYEMFFYPGFELARRMGIPCVRQFSQSAWSPETWKEAPPVFRFSAMLIDVQVFPRSTAKRYGLDNRCLRDGILRCRPELNIVYLPEAFQSCRGSFDDSYLFLVPKQEMTGSVSSIPYERMTGPVVYISLGSIISNRGFCRECIRAFGNTEFSVILNTGKIPPASLGTIPANIYAYPFVPQLEVLSHTDVFLTHCGMNSVNEAISLGVPMVAMPFINDQITNAKRIVELGLGKKVRSFPSRGKDLLKAVRSVCSDASIRKNMEDMRRSLDGQPSWDDVIGRIEDLTAR